MFELPGHSWGRRIQEASSIPLIRAQHFEPTFGPLLVFWLQAGRGSGVTRRKLACTPLFPHSRTASARRLRMPLLRCLYVSTQVGRFISTRTNQALLGSHIAMGTPPVITQYIYAVQRLIMHIDRSIDAIGQCSNTCIGLRTCQII